MAKTEEQVTYKCDRCNKDRTFKDIGYMGPPGDPYSVTKCHPTMHLLTVCKKCIRKNNGTP